MKEELTAHELSAMGYDEEDIALMANESLLAEIKAAKKEYARGEYIEWHPGMFTESEPQNPATSKSSERQNLSASESTPPFPRLQSIRTMA